MTKLSRCQGSNLLNYLRQKNIDFEIEQYNFLSPRDVEVETSRGNVVEVGNINLMSNPEYIAHIKFNDENYELNYIHREQHRLSKLPLWRTKFSFQGKTVYSLNSSKKSSLEQALTQMDGHIRSFLGL